MSDKPPPGVLGGLPRTRPHRRSQKRPARSPDLDAVGLKPQPANARSSKPPEAKPRSAHTGTQATPRPTRPTQVRVAKPRPPAPPTSTAGPLETAVQAAAELAEIGLSVSARALRGALSRLPRP